MPKYGTQALAKTLDQFYSAIFEKGTRNAARQLAPASIYGDLSGESTDGFYTQPLYVHRVHGPLGASQSGGVFSDDGYLPASRGYLYVDDIFIDYQGTNIIFRVPATHGSSDEVFAECLFTNVANPPSGDTRWRLSRKSNGTWEFQFTVGSSDRQLTVADSGDSSDTRTIACYLSRTQIGLSVDGGPYIFLATGDDVSPTFPTAGSRSSPVSFGKSAAGANPITSPLRWVVVHDGEFLPVNVLDEFHDLDDRIPAGAQAPTKTDLLREANEINSSILGRLTFAWLCKSADHIALSAVGDGFIAPPIFNPLTEMSKYSRGAVYDATLAQYRARCVAANQDTVYTPPSPITSDYTPPAADNYIIRQRFLLRTKKRWNQVTLHMPNGNDNLSRVYVVRSNAHGRVTSSVVGEIGHDGYTPNPVTKSVDFTIANWGVPTSDGYYYFYLEAYFVEVTGGEIASWRLGYRDENNVVVAPTVVSADFVA